jgi:ElaB/YqjD/DUF883 family membrane-anchored ribosome-binding protein
MNTQRTPEEIARENEQVRQDIDSTLEELEHRLDAGRMLREGLDFMRNTDAVRYTAAAAATASRVAREHPVPAAIAGVGALGLLIWGMRARSHSRIQPSSFHGLTDALGTARERLAEAKRALAGSTGGTRRRMSDAGSEAWRRIGDAGNEARTMVRDHPVATSAVGLAIIALAAAALVPMMGERRGR